MFWMFNIISPVQEIDKGKQIVVDRNKLITFMQHRTKVFETDRANKMFDDLSDQEVQLLIDQYVQEEALFREAKSLKLEKNDYTFRQRLVRQLQFINEGFLSTNIELDDSDLKKYLNDNKQRYKIPEKITFTHVYFSADNNQNHEQLAKEKLTALIKDKVKFHQALAHGERFLYHRNYVKKSAPIIASHFGENFRREVFSLKQKNQWLGPISSAYGSHLVMITELTSSYIPQADEIKQQLMRDATQDQLKKEIEIINQSIVDNYHVDVSALNLNAGQ